MKEQDLEHNIENFIVYKCIGNGFVGAGFTYKLYFLIRKTSLISYSYIILNVKNREVGLTPHDNETSCCGLPMSKRTVVLRMEGMRV